MSKTDKPVTGSLFTISAPSGAGKTSLVEALAARDPGLSVSISHTTRPIRHGEKDGTNYFFVTRNVFETMLANSEFLEHATVFENLYGTSRLRVQETVAAGRDVILEIDWQGARQVRERIEACRSIFILPPSRDALQIRLRKRAQDDPQIIKRRMAQAIGEMSHYAEADYLVVNDDFDTALTALQAIITANRLRLSLQHSRLQGLLADLLGDSALSPTDSTKK